MATEQDRARLSIERGKVAVGIKDPKKRRDFISRQGDQEAIRSNHLTELMEETHRERNRQEAEKVLGSFDHIESPQTVRQDGVYRLRKGEIVSPTEKHLTSHPGQAHPAGEPHPDSHVQKLRKKQLGSNGMQGN